MCEDDGVCGLIATCPGNPEKSVCDYFPPSPLASYKEAALLSRMTVVPYLKVKFHFDWSLVTESSVYTVKSRGLPFTESSVYTVRSRGLPFT